MFYGNTGHSSANLVVLSLTTVNHGKTWYLLDGNFTNKGPLSQIPPHQYVISILFLLTPSSLNQTLRS